MEDSFRASGDDGGDEELDSAYVDSFFLPGGILDDSEVDGTDKNMAERNQPSLLDGLYNSSTSTLSSPQPLQQPVSGVSQNPWDSSGSGDYADVLTNNSVDTPALLANVSSDTSQTPLLPPTAEDNTTSWLRPATAQSASDQGLLTQRQMSDSSTRASSIPPPPGLAPLPPPGFESSALNQQWRQSPARSQDHMDIQAVGARSERRSSSTSSSRSFDDVDTLGERVISGNPECVSLLTGIKTSVLSVSNDESELNVPSDWSTAAARSRSTGNNSSSDNFSTPISSADNVRSQKNKRNDSKRGTKLSQQRNGGHSNNLSPAPVQETLQNVSLNKASASSKSVILKTRPQPAAESSSNNESSHQRRQHDSGLGDKPAATTSGGAAVNHHHRRRRKKNNVADPQSPQVLKSRGESIDEPVASHQVTKTISQPPPRQEPLFQVAANACSAWISNLFGTPLSRALEWISDFYKLIINPVIIACGQYIFYALVLVLKFAALFTLALAYTTKYALEEAMIAHYVYDYFNLKPAIYAVRSPPTSLLCYLALYLTPPVCDWLMDHMFLPHYFPHILSGLAMYFVCHRLSQLSSRERKMLRRRSKSGDYNSGHRHFSEADRRRLGNDLSLAILHSIRWAIPCCFVVDGFSDMNASYMLLDTSTRLVIAYSLSLTRSGLLLSPVAWIGWSVQVLLAAYFPSGFLLDNMLFFIGMAFIRLCTTLQSDRSTTI